MSSENVKSVWTQIARYATYIKILRTISTVFLQNRRHRYIRWSPEISHWVWHRLMMFIDCPFHTTMDVVASYASFQVGGKGYRQEGRNYTEYRAEICRNQISTVSASALAHYDGARRLRLMESEILSEGNQKFWFQDAVLQNVCSKVWMLLFLIPPWRLEHILCESDMLAFAFLIPK